MFTSTLQIQQWLPSLWRKELKMLKNVWRHKLLFKQSTYGNPHTPKEPKRDCSVTYFPSYQTISSCNFNPLEQRCQTPFTLPGYTQLDLTWFGPAKRLQFLSVQKFNYRFNKSEIFILKKDMYSIYGKIYEIYENTVKFVSSFIFSH